MPSMASHNSRPSSNINLLNGTQPEVFIRRRKIEEHKKSLPIASVENRLLEEVSNNDILIIVGETGSGKTTQLPQYLFNGGFCRNGGLIGITQPRRVAAVTVAKRVAEECAVALGQQVGYAIRFEDVTSSSTRIKYMTDGLLLREALLDPYLSKYSVIIVDEAHERTVHTDVLLGLLKNVQRIRSQGASDMVNGDHTKDENGIFKANDVRCSRMLQHCRGKKFSPLKLIIMSASLDGKIFSEYFGGAKAVHVQGRQYPVETLYTHQPETDYVDAALITIFQIHLEEGPGDILVFLTGQEEIESIERLVHERLPKLPESKRKLLVFPLFASLPSEKQMKVFMPAPAGFRKVILATNIAETSVTIPGIKFVIDPGMVKVRTYDTSTGIEPLIIVKTSKAQALQRSGRAGREGPGKCYRLYPESEFDKLKDSTTPEIKRCNLSNVILQLKALGIDDIVGFDFIEEPGRRSRKMEKSSSTIGTSASRWMAENAVAGNSEALQALRELITYPLLYPRESEILGLKWPHGLMLHGPPGTGKTSLVRAVVRECDAHLIVISPHSVHRSHAGESEKVLREAFAEAKSHAKLGKPSVIFIDEIDALCPRRDSRREQDIRIASQLFMLMDSNKSSPTSGSHVVVVASTNRVDAIDSALRRSGRFDAEVEVSMPNEVERFEILKLYTKKLPLDPNVDLQAIAASCNGYVGADLEALCRETTMSALNKCSKDSQCIITMDDWKHGRSVVGPSITRGVTVEIPRVSWEDIGGLKDLKKKLQQAVEWPLKHSSVFSRMGVAPIRGILLHGPPGCSKTTLAKAAASAAKASFFSLSGAELYSMYVGEGEALLRNTFRKARLAAPSIIFFDEADVVAAKRGGSSSGCTTVGERLLSTLLTEMDGLEQAKGILVLAATNRPHAIDAALMRPGRFDLVLYVPPPDLEARYEILCVHTRKMKVDNDVDLRQIAEDIELFTGAEVEGLCREAGIVALREDISATVVCNRHFQTVLRSLKPALTKEDVESYASFSKNQFLRPVSPTESSTRPKGKGSKTLFLSAAAVAFGIISLINYWGLF